MCVCGRKQDYEVMATADISAIVKKTVESVSQTLGIPPATTEILLRHFGYLPESVFAVVAVHALCE